MGSWFQKFWEKRLAKEKSGSGTVLSRRLECTWVVVFRLDSGKELELNVSEDQYRDLREGTRVELTLKGNDLISFQKL